MCTTLVLAIALHWPAPANIVSPKSGATVSTTPTLCWQNSAGTDEVAVLVAQWPDDPYFSPVPIYIGPAIETITLPELATGTRYNWMIVDLNEEGWSESDVWEFETAP